MELLLGFSLHDLVHLVLLDAKGGLELLLSVGLVTSTYDVC